MSPTEKVLDALVGVKLSSDDIAKATGLSDSHARTVVCRLKLAKKLHVFGYEQQEKSGRYEWKALYKLGRGPKVPPVKPPRMSSAEHYTRYHKRGARKLVNSVFALGAPTVKLRGQAAAIRRQVKGTRSGNARLLGAVAYASASSEG